jgi:hypothetical protein
MEIPLQNPDFIVTTIICGGVVVIMGILLICTVIGIKIFE